ncbi:MAG: hypothetical protein ABW162_07525 [Candidatus Sedimenticola sp. PURPLELP]
MKRFATQVFHLRFIPFQLKHAEGKVMLRAVGANMIARLEGLLERGSPQYHL